MTAPDDLSVLDEKPFADAVARFEELLTQSCRAFLLGAGCSRCAGLPLTAELTQDALQSAALDSSTKAVLAAIRENFTGSTDAGIEDYLSELVDLIAIAERRTARGATQKDVSLGGSSYSETLLRNAATQIKQAIARVIERAVSIRTHRDFIRAVHRPHRPGKGTSGQTVDYLILNYDTIIEDALALESVPFADGLDGGVTGWWCPSTFDRAGLAARVFKLHGSINWCELPDDPLPRRVGDLLQVEGAKERRVLIWPASTKYREVQFDPYAQLAERARRALRPSGGAQCVLIVCGYRFSDAHINLEIERSLRESSGQLTVVVFSSEDEPTGQLAAWRRDESIADQVLVFANRGFFHGSHVATTVHDLLWWKFENMTRLLEGER